MPVVSGRQSRPPAIRRIASLAPLSDAEISMLARASAEWTHLTARREFVIEGDPVTQMQILLSGWVASVRQLADGRRQILGFLLPGDIIGLCPQPEPLALSTLTSLTDVSVCPAPRAAPHGSLARAYAMAKALDEAHHLAHICRVGRLNAQERLADLLLELHDRLELAGLTDGGSFELPLTQEILADALGLTQVHVNRTLQLMRRSGDLDWKERRVTLHDPSALAVKIGRDRVRVSALQSPAV